MMQWYLGARRQLVPELVTSADNNGDRMTKLLLLWAASGLTPVLATSPGQAPSAQTRFLLKMCQVQDLTSSEADEYRDMTEIHLL